MLKREDEILFSGGALGAEEAFGACAESFGIEEVNFSFDGHKPARTRGLRVLNHEELAAGDVSLGYVSRLMNRRYPDTPTFRKILQSIWYQINNGQEIYVIGAIQPDQTVRGGTGWGAEFAKLCNKPLFVFDQEQGRLVPVGRRGLDLGREKRQRRTRDRARPLHWNGHAHADAQRARRDHRPLQAIFLSP